MLNNNSQAPVDNNFSDEENEMVRGLSGRHVQLIAIGGTIGTGLFLGSGATIHFTGPSVMLIYLIAGAFMFVFMRAIGEMLYQDPSQHTFINFITKYVSHGWGYFAGWSYWLSLVLLGMTELTAVAQYFVNFFITFGINLSDYIWLIQIGFLVLLACVNLVAVKIFGEVEFWFAMIKIILILGLIATGVVMVILGFHYQATTIHGIDNMVSHVPSGTASLSNIFHNFSLFPNGVKNFFLAFQMVFFAYQAMEFVGITISEVKNPREVLPKTIDSTVFRILIFYIGALLAIMAIVPWTDFLPSANGTYNSPFIMVFKYAGLNWASALVFFIVVTSAASALNSVLYSTGRHLYQLGTETKNRFIRQFGTVSKTGVPAKAMLISAFFILISPFLSMIPQIQSAFTLLSSASSAVYLGIYILVMIAHIRYRQSEDFMKDGFVMPVYKILDPLTILFFLFVFVILFLSPATIVSGIGGLIWIVVFGIISNFVKRGETAE